MKAFFWWVLVPGIAGATGWGYAATAHESGHGARLGGLVLGALVLGALFGCRVAIWALQGRHGPPVIDNS